jgi:phospholipid/cholesterol/gamma-HCH transport system substrate-binding protein
MPQTVKVGLFMTAALALLAWLILRVEDWRLFGHAGKRVDAVFDSVQGLDDKAAIRVAGVRVGRVDGIHLEGRKARVTLLLETDVPLTEGAEASIANLGLLGDKFVELDPGPQGAPPLAAGAVLPGRSPVSIDQALAKIEKIGDSVEGFLSGGGAGGGLGDLVSSIRQTSDELRAVIVENRQSLGGTVKNFERFSSTLAEDLPRLTSQIERVLGQVDAVLAENRGNLKDSMGNIKELTAKVQTSVDNLNEITGKIASGEGTIGKLVNSDEAHDELISALDSVKSGVDTLSDTLGRVSKLKLDVAMDADYLTDQNDSRSSVRLNLWPKGDDSRHVYRFDVVNDPRGRVSEKTDTITVTNPDGTTETTTINRTTVEKRRYDYTAMFGFPLLDRRLLLWGGLIETTGGVQVEYGLVPKKLWLSLEAYDFSREQNLDPHLRLSATWFPWRNVYVRGGYDDPLVARYRSPFVGAGVTWSDDDLKYLLGSVPKF